MKRLIDVFEGKQDNYILPFFWLHGEEEAVLREYMQKIQEAGIQAVCVESRPHPDFMGEKWWQDMDIVMDEARKRDMKVWVFDDARFPTGYANGKIASDYPEYLKKYLKIYQLDFIGPLKDASFLVKWGSILIEGYQVKQDKLIKVIAGQKTGTNTVDPNTFQDVTHLIAEDGVLYWDIPEGEWRIFVLAETRNGGEKSTEEYLNPLDSRAVRVLIDEVYQPHFERYKDDFGKTFAGFFSDEPRFGNSELNKASIGRFEMVLPWKEGLLDEFSEEEVLRLPLLAPIEANGEEFPIRYKYMDVVSEMYGQSFSNTLGTWCRERGVEYIGHVIEDNNAHARLGQGAGHFFRALGGQDMSGIDVVLNQILPGMDKHDFKCIANSRGLNAEEYDGEFYHYGLAKLGTSAGQLDPRKKNRTVCEIYGAYGWSEGIKLMKWLTDHMLVRGMTHFIPHAFSAKQYPDYDCPPHFYGHGHNPQYRYMNVLFNYLNRVSHLLNGGKSASNIGVLYHAEAEWLGDYMLFQKPARQLMQNQIDFTVVPSELVVDAKIEGQAFILNDSAFEALIIPYAERLPQALLEKVNELSKAGVSVIFIEGQPLANEKENKLNEQLLKGTEVVVLSQIVNVLQEKGMYKVKTSDQQPYLRYYQYEQTDGNVYMFFNEDPYKKITTEMTLANDVRVVKYNGFSNKLEYISQKIVNGKTVINLELEAYESTIILESSEEVLADPIFLNRKVIEGEWRVSRAGALEYPKFSDSVMMNELKDLSRVDGFKQFSGTIRYEINFELENKPEKARLDLGRVYEIAEVTLNGENLGERITPPYNFSVEGALVEGLNHLIIEVTNNLGKQHQDYLSQFMVQEPSGLLGPIELRTR